MKSQKLIKTNIHILKNEFVKIQTLKMDNYKLRSTIFLRMAMPPSPTYIGVGNGQEESKGEPSWFNFRSISPLICSGKQHNSLKYFS